ncbi:GGDEF domain-containing protein [Pseudidiomarina gelatinasegens]|uniref:diguanylate cyclase n=1 Tax=Pseudidiomarina gelatinasegens TaxID=2487740 RepID=A0A443YZD6_9GAMM|nr:tetratricopeptide repeat-containing diguanylate cyclase [Pseudidiomarina gelatinasegens]RWU09522.1 GGDEF domain-containing protein [Pseudidiomarina gelatinasegens]
MPKITFLIALVLSVFFVSAHAQETTAPAVDQSIEGSLDDVLNAANTETSMQQLQDIYASLTPDTPVMSRVRTLSYIALDHAYLGNYEDAQQTIAEVRMIANQSRLADAKAEVEATALLISAMQGKISQAMANLNDALIPLEQAQLPRVKYYVHNLAAYLYGQRSQFDRSLEHLIYAADAVAETNDGRTLIRLLSTKTQIANLYGRQKNYDLAIEQLDDAQRIAEENGLLEDFQQDFMFERAYIESQRNNYDAALGLYQRLRNMLKDNPDEITSYLTVLNNMGDVDIRIGRYEDARTVLNEAYNIAQLNQQQFNPEIILFNLGYVDVFLGDVENGLIAMRKVIDDARETWSPAELEQLLGEYAEALIHLQRNDEAIQVLLEQRDLRDEAYKGDQQKSIAELQNLYDSKDKAMQIELLSQKNELNQQLIENESQKRTILLLFVIVAVFAMVLVALLYRAARRSNLELKVANSKLAEQSMRDPLTGLLNRRALQDKLKSPHPASQDAMLLLDIDHFKRINDNLGHAVGDDVLVEVSKRLLQVSRESDLVVRWGGEEFLIYISNTEKAKLPIMAKRMLDVIGATPIKGGDREISVTATAGFISYPFADLHENQMDWEETLQLADMVLYAGKVHGRNQAWGVMALNKPFAEVQTLLETDLPGAIEQDAISVEIIHGPEQQKHK